jgi:iron-sulfur cluster assembly protein
MVTLTPQAIKEAKRLIAEQNNPNLALRVGVKGGGCSGFSYAMGFDAEKRTMDEVFEQDGIKILCDPKSHLYLDGITIDFKNDLTDGGFRFINPNAKGSCGCGSSFSV